MNPKNYKIIQPKFYPLLLEKGQEGD